MSDPEKTLNGFSDEEKKIIKELCRNEIESRERGIASSIEKVGGEKKLPDRIDHLIWVYHDREEIEKYQETIRFLDGDKEVDVEKISWVMNTFRQRERYYRSSAENTRRIIEEKVYSEERLLEETEIADQAKTAVNALVRETLKMQS